MLALGDIRMVVGVLSLSSRTHVGGFGGRAYWIPVDDEELGMAESGR